MCLLIFIFFKGYQDNVCYHTKTYFNFYHELSKENEFKNICGHTDMNMDVRRYLKVEVVINIYVFVAISLSSLFY